MATSFSKPIQRFFRFIEEDREFFDYYHLSDSEALDIATTRARAYLQEAIRISISQTMTMWRGHFMRI